MRQCTATYIDYAYLYADEVKNKGNLNFPKQKDGIIFGKVDKQLVDEVLEMSGVDLSDSYHALRDNDIRHIKNSHGEDTSEKYPITIEDQKKIPDIIKNYDDVLYVENGTKKGLFYVKRHNGVTYYLEAIREDGKILSNKQMIKVPTGTIPDVKGLREAINKKWNIDSGPNDKTVPRMYVQDVENTNVPIKSIPQKEYAVKSVFENAGKLIIGEDVISDGKIAIPRTEESLAAAQTATKSVPTEDGTFTMDKLYNGENDVVIAGTPRVMERNGVKQYVFEVDGKLYACRKAHYDAFGGNGNIIRAGANESTPWTVHTSDGKLAAVMMPLKTKGITQADYNAMPKAVNATETKNTAQSEAVSFSIDSGFEAAYDRWKANGHKDGVRLFVGTTSKALRSIGVKAQQIFWDSSKINKSLLDHKTYLNDGILKQVPLIIENPVIVMRSKSIPSRLTMFGEVYDGDGLPIMAVIELLPTNHKNGLVLDEIKIVSTHSRKNLKKPADMTQTQGIIDSSEILYVDPDKKRTDTWLVTNRLQLPLHVTEYGPIKRITYPDANVKGNIAKSSLEGSTNNEGRSLLSDGSGQRSYSTSAGKQAKGMDGRTSRYRERRSTAYERRKYCQALKASGLTEQKIIYDHKCEVIPEKHYTGRMKKIAAKNTKDGFDETVFITGKAEILSVKDSKGNPKTAKGIFIKADGRKIAVVQYDNEWYTPEQINDHEKVHDRYNAPLTVKVRNILKNSLTVAEKKRVLEKLSKDYDGIIEGNEEKVFEEFVANVLSGMNEYTMPFNDLVHAFWKGDEAFIDRFEVAMYTESIDAGDSVDKQKHGGEIRYNPRGLNLPQNEQAKFISSVGTEYYYSYKTHQGLQYQSCVTDKTHILYVYEDYGFGKYNVVARVDYVGEDGANVFVEVLKGGKYYNITEVVNVVLKTFRIRRSGYTIYNAYTKKRRGARSNGSLLKGTPKPLTGRTDGSGDGIPGNSGRTEGKRTDIKADEVVIPEEGKLIIKYSLDDDGEFDLVDIWNQRIEEFGAIPKGEKPARDTKVPKKIAKDKPVSQTVRTILEAKATPEETLPTIEKMVLDGVFSYDAYTDKQAIKDADAHIKEYGWDESLDAWFNDVEKGVVSKQHTAMGWALYNNAANIAATTTSETEKTTAIKTSLKILDAMVRHQRSAAQALQATRILKKLSPETQLYGVAKSVHAFQQELTDKYGDKAPNLKISEKLAEEFLNAETEEERAEIEKEIYKDIGRQMPSRFIDKWNAWRYLAMLGNVRTHTRNIVGNAFFAPVVLAKNLTATAIESAVNRVSPKKIVRGKALITGSKADKALLKAAWSDYGNVSDIISNGGKYNDSAMANRHIEEGRRIFKTKPLEWARKKNSALLEKEDMWFSKPHYAYALAQYCKANNITAEQIKRGKAIAPAREYAIKEAQKATYRDTNAFSQFVSSLGRGGEIEHVPKVASMAVEGVLPFRKTPANILVRGVEYSPIGLLKGLTYDLEQVQKGKMETHEAIDNISAGLTGTGLLALGVLLAAQGLIRGHGEEDKDEKEFKEMMGHQSYALELPNGQSITLDWLAPEALPFFVGVNIWEATKGAKEEANLSTILKAVSSISEPMLEMSCLQSLNDLSESVGYATSNDTSGLVTILSSAATSYLTQGIPTLLGQAERTGEENRMTTYTEKNAFLTSDMQYTLGKASAKIPFWDYQQIPYIDAWGRKEASGTALKRGFNNFLNPAYTSTVEESKMEKELLRLFEKTGESSVFPKRADKYFTVDGKRKDLTADEYVRYATMKGEKSLNAVKSLVTSNAYKKLTDGEKVRAIEDAYDYANQKAKKAISSGYKTDTWVSTADAFGANVGNFLSFRSEVSNTKQESGGKLSKQDIVDIVIDMAQNDSEAWKMYLSMYDSTSDAYAYDNGIAGGTYMSFLESLNDVDTPTDSGKFGTYTQKEATNAINQLEGLSRDEKAILWQSVNQNWKAKNNPFR